LKRYEEALAAYDRVLPVNPDLDCVEGSRLHAKMNLCRWDNLEREISHLKEAIKAGKANSAPFVMLSLSDSPEDQLRCAKAWASARHPGSAAAGQSASHAAHKKIRIGYVSPDFGQHAVSYLAARIFETHDKNRFELYGFSLAPDDKSELRQRLQRSFDGFVDLHHRSDGDAVDQMKAAQLDIVVDLGGYTLSARPSLFFARPAPIAVNFLGFAGTLGSGRPGTTSSLIER
jgi:predicted O-linked N-acetylglucosamine transferase (SPINDLY family)